MIVSVAIPTVDREQLLLQALKACSAQLDIPGGAEIVVVDNSAAGSQRRVVQAARDRNPQCADRLRYVHEPQPGLSHARNRAIAEARGEFVIFLDDDELPHEGWLQALVAAMDMTGADAAFGVVEPAYEEPPTRLTSLIRRLYTRNLSMARHEDVSRYYNLLGTGNSCFRKRTCFASDMEPFDPRFNETGGEDTDLLRRLSLSGRKFVWAPNAVVDEIIPVSRFTPNYMGTRRFMQGQMRSFAHMASIPRRLDLAMFWMAAGAIQFVGHTMIGAAASLAGRDEVADSHRVQAQGGLGKVLWQARYRRKRYG